MMYSSGGRVQVAWWACRDCADSSGEVYGGTAEGIRALAARHVEQEGHRVSVFRGITEELLPMRTEPGLRLA